MAKQLAKQGGNAADNFRQGGEKLGIFKSSNKSTKGLGAKAKFDAKRTKKFNEDEANVEFKKGGSVRGWGMARGARKAKIV